MGTSYSAPVAEQLFVLTSTRAIADHRFGRIEDAPTPETIEAVLAESAKLANNVFAPINQSGDVETSRAVLGGVATPAGFQEAYALYVAGGWNGLAVPVAYGGQGLPFALGHAVNEQITSANAALAGCPQLTWGAIEAIATHATEDLRRVYLPKLVTGEWTATMNLTEPQAGTDVGAIRTSATPQSDGTYKIRGQKIFISFGDHDLSANIVHLVLARLPGAPVGSKGLSLFLVPKFFVGDGGTLGIRNDVRAVSLEHKLGQRASPTCMMSYGDEDRCVGYLIGEEQGGIRAMFTMMNNARVNVGVQGVAFAERSYQHALGYAQERVQSRRYDGGSDSVAIIQHPDVRRMLLSQRASTEGIRALLYYTAEILDRASGNAEAQGLVDLLTPIAKAYATDVGTEVTSSALQVFGGIGFIEETGIAQHYRDVRITPIYEGTNGIQAIDLVNRKLLQSGGIHWKALLKDLRDQVAAVENPALDSIRGQVSDAINALESASDWMASRAGSGDAMAGATAYLRLFGTVLSCTLLFLQAAQRTDAGDDPQFMSAKATTARFFAEQILPLALALTEPMRAGNGLLEEFAREFAPL